jgi:hypothetical protein
MSTIERYRAHAHDCLRRAHTDANDCDRPLWLTLAQSWLQLAEHVDRIGSSRESEDTDVERDREAEEEAVNA